MDDHHLRCNNRTANGAICRKELKQTAIVTTCSHVLCKECAERTGFFGTDKRNRECPVCKQPLVNVDDAAETNLQPTEEYKMSVLCGFDPNTIMECASNALSFWNYQVLQETAYQQHLLLALSKKYSHLNDGVNKLVDDANGQIDSLHNKIEGMNKDNQRLQEKSAELASTCRERGKKYSELRKGYEVLKKIVQTNNQNPITEHGAEQAVRTFVANPVLEVLGGQKIGKPSTPAAPDPLAIQQYGSSNIIDQRGYHLVPNHPHAEGERRYSGNLSEMPPPLRPSNAVPDNLPSQHRTPLPRAFRIPADRSNASVSIDRVSHTVPLGNNSVRRQTFRPPGPHSNGSSSRHNTAGGFGGISAGMKVGGPITDSQIRAQTGYVPARNTNHYRHDPLLNPSRYFERI